MKFEDLLVARYLAKCVSRKCRCTYVKFHRQTAPVGPGHPPPNAMPQQTHRGGMLGPGYADDMMFGAAQSSMGGMYMPAEYSLPPASSLYPAHTQPYSDPRDNAILLSREAIEASPELLARYRAQADMMGRGGVMPNGLAHSMSAAQGTVVPGLYGPDSQELGRYDLSSSSAQAWAHPGHGHSFQDGGHVSAKVGHGAGVVDGFSAGSQRPFPGGGGSAALQAHPPTHGAPFPPISGPHGQGPGAGAYVGGSLQIGRAHV